ncbi:MAG: hypothetical protein LBC71_05095, partial [Oscillospiraceae bacterium]|nr:hypothetical protein [Oscillospiraceae bacterium]
TTTRRDLISDDDVRIVLLTLAESVGTRLREQRFKGYVVELSLRSTALTWMSHQRKLKRATDTTREILDVAYELFKEVRMLPLRSIGIRMATLVDVNEPEQLSLFVAENEINYNRSIDRAVDEIRNKFGYHSISRGGMGKAFTSFGEQNILTSFL